MLNINIFSKKSLIKTLNILVISFLVIQPIFDLKIFYNSFSTLIRVIIISILFFVCFFMDKNKRKWYLLIYPFIVLVYIIFHHYNALKFNSLVPGNFGYSFLKELLYFVKMITPFLLIYILYNSNLNKNIIFKIIKTIVLTMGLIIIVSNLFVFSYSSYNDQIIKANFFSWFNNTNNYNYLELSSKGLFEYANQISAVMLMFLPFCLISFIEKKSTVNFLVILVNIFSLFLLSTKVAVFGVFIVFVYTLSVYIINTKFFKKQKILINAPAILLAILILYGVVLPINPSFMRINETKAIIASSDTVIEDNNEVINLELEAPATEPNTTSALSDAEYIEQNYKEKEIKKEFITERYPYQYDTEFWLGIFNEPRYNRVNYRFIELAMVKRVVQINNNKLDILFGITNTRLQNLFNIEKDFVVQYYALGIIGLVLVFVPYFALLGIYLYQILKSKFKYLTTTNITSFITIVLMFGISYYSGNLLNSLSFTIYFALLFTLLIHKNN